MCSCARVVLSLCLAVGLAAPAFPQTQSEGGSVAGTQFRGNVFLSFPDGSAGYGVFEPLLFGRERALYVTWVTFVGDTIDVFQGVAPYTALSLTGASTLDKRVVRVEFDPANMIAVWQGSTASGKWVGTFEYAGDDGFFTVSGTNTTDGSSSMTQSFKNDANDTRWRFTSSFTGTSVMRWSARFSGVLGTHEVDFPNQGANTTTMQGVFKSLFEGWF